MVTRKQKLKEEIKKSYYIIGSLGKYDIIEKSIYPQKIKATSPFGTSLKKEFHTLRGRRKTKKEALLRIKELKLLK